MKSEINIKTLCRISCAIIGIAAVAWVALDNGAQKIWHFFVELCIFSVQVIMITSCALAVQWFAQFVRSHKMFDTNGAGEEMNMVQARIGGKDEKDMDALACALKYSGWTLFSAVVILAFFLSHMP